MLHVLGRQSQIALYFLRPKTVLDVAPVGFMMASCWAPAGAPAWAPAWATPGLLLGYSRATVVRDIVKPCSSRSGRTSWRLVPRAWKVDEHQL